MSTPVPSVSLIISVYEREDFLSLILTSLLNQTLKNFEVIVADDGSGPGVADVIHKWQGAFAHPIVHVRHDDDGFRKTIIVNRAATHARADLLVFIDGDCVLHHRFLERHFQRRKRGVVFSGRRVLLDKQLTERVTAEDVRARRIERRDYWWNNAGKIDRWWGLYLPFMHGMRNIGKLTYRIVGSNFSVHRNDFMRVNGYDERIVGRGVEDTNLEARFLNAGVGIGTITREALQYHLFHTADPIPHSDEFIERYHSTDEAFTSHGIQKD